MWICVDEVGMSIVIDDGYGIAMEKLGDVDHRDSREAILFLSGVYDS